MDLGTSMELKGTRSRKLTTRGGVCEEMGEGGITNKLWFSPKSWNEASIFIVGGNCVLDGLPQPREVSLTPLPCLAGFLWQVSPSMVSIPLVGCAGRRGECLGRSSQGPGVLLLPRIGDRWMSVNGSRPSVRWGCFHLASDCILENYLP